MVLSFTYTLMIAILSAQNMDTVNFQIDAIFSLTIIGIVAIFIIYKIDGVINRLNIKRTKSIFVVNLFISFFASSIFFIVISWLLNVFLRGNWVLNFVFLKQQILLLNFLLILTLSYHTITYFIQSLALRNKKLTADNLELSLELNKYLTRIPSLSNKKTILIAIAQVSYFKIEDGVVFAFTKDQQRHPLTITTLNALEAKLNPTVFFRINRSEIINIDEVASYESYIKDRLAIKLTNHNLSLYTSNTKSAPFRDWLLGSIE